MELTLSFAEIDRVTVTLTNRSPVSIPFTSPLTKEDWEDMQWYLEAYPNQYAADVDDRRADRIVAKLKVWGQELFQAVFSDRSAERLFDEFQDAEGEGRQLTIAASQPEILRLPWELLCDPQGTYLLHEQPRIAIRRQLAGAGGGRKPIDVKPKAQLRLLMVVSRPDGAGFIDPRSEAQAVLQAIEKAAPGRVVLEFLRPATLANLVERLEDRQLPAIDVVHFDGHGSFDGDLGIGYLLFEDKDGKVERVSADRLGEALRQKVSLMVLSACESAKVTGDDALGCVAARLTHSGIPAVLAMTYSVLVTTTEQLFGRFYGDLAGGQSLGVALANARQDLHDRQQRGKTWRGTEQVEQNLSDWFLPAWYQSGNDIQLLHPSAEVPSIASPRHQLPQLAAEGFFGRSRDLWDIERAFLKGKQRLTISGFGGQGKTYLALEAGQWMSQTGMFDVVCFVSYAAFQGIDPVGFAVWEIGMVLEQSFLDAAAVQVALEQQRTLLILDNLESLEAEALQELLTVAKEWSEVGETRLLLTTRNRDLNHPDYPVGRSLAHQRLLLGGLGDERDPEDAIKYFQGLMKLPPEPTWGLPTRAELINLFKLVDFHPLSIKSVAEQCKKRRVDDLEQSLKQLLAEELKGQDEQQSLIASLNLSLQWLDADLLELLPRLGVFQGGAWEPQILDITEFAPDQWQRLKVALQQIGLLQIEVLENIKAPFLLFHPTLAPVLLGQLLPSEQANLILTHHQHYYGLISALYNIDGQSPFEVRSISRRELPNLLWAVKRALEARSENITTFVYRLNHFLDYFGLKRDRLFITDCFNKLFDSNDWCLMFENQAEHLFQSGQYSAAITLLDRILQELSLESSFDRVRILGLLGRCNARQGQLSTATQYLQEGLELSMRLDPSKEVKKQWGTLQIELGNILTELGEFQHAHKAYESSLATMQEIDERQGAAIVKGLMGNLSMKQGDLKTAAQQHMQALYTFNQLQQPLMEARAWHQLGIVCQKGRQWMNAECAYRNAARIKEKLGDIAGVAGTHNQLGNLSRMMNKPIEAEAWYCKALHNYRSIENKLCESTILNNLASLLASQPQRLLEAQKLAKAALEIKKTLNPAATEIWATYNILAKMANAQNQQDKAREYRQLARTTKMDFVGTQHELQQDSQFIIELVVAAVENEAARAQLEPVLVRQTENGWGQLLVAAIRLVLAGEREIEVLWDDLDADDSMIIAAILRRISSDL
jgi:tetratricopeptide (TPR) repeat protein